MRLLMVSFEFWKFYIMCMVYKSLEHGIWGRFVIYIMHTQQEIAKWIITKLYTCSNIYQLRIPIQCTCNLHVMCKYSLVVDFDKFIIIFFAQFCYQIINQGYVIKKINK